VVLETAADTGDVGDDLNAVALQQGTGTNPRKLQQLRRVDGAARKHQLPPDTGGTGFTVVQIADPRSPPAFE
jgi:hypothetical protein